MFKKKTRILLAILTTVALLAIPAAASEDSDKNPYTQPNNSWISLSGTVEEVHPHSFTLDYGDGIVTVEMDDGDRDADAYSLLKGDQVTVSGIVDDDLWETTTIEASSVYVESIGTYFYASPVDEEDRFFVDSFVTVTTPIVASEVRIQGVVTDVAINEFTVDTGLTDLTVEISEMPYNPLDDEGYQKIEVGDRVSVRGHMTNDFFEGRELDAESVIELSN